MLLIYIAISFYKYIGEVVDDDEDWRRYYVRQCVTITVIEVIAAVTAAVLLVVGSVLSTQNG